MKTVYINSETMREHGIDILTGEACAITMRLLCEVEPKMMQTYLDYTGFKTSLENIRTSQYNNRNKYSCFLTHEVIEDLIIMQLMEENEMVVEILPNEQNPETAHLSLNKYLLVGDADEVREYCRTHFDNSPIGSFYRIGRTYWIYKEQPRRGLSNIHAFSGLSQ